MFGELRGCVIALNYNKLHKNASYGSLGAALAAQSLLDAVFGRQFRTDIVERGGGILR